MSDRIRIKFKNKEITKEERGDHFDEIYGTEAFKSLTRGVIAELERSGVIKSGEYDDEISETIEVGCDDEEVYQRVKKIQQLDALIVRQKRILNRLQKAIKGKTCQKPTNDELLAYCNKIILVGKGKAMEKKK